MDSSVVPITLIVVLLIGAILFVVVSSRASGFGPGPTHPPRPSTPTGNTRSGQRRRRRSGIIGTILAPLRRAPARAAGGATRASGSAAPRGQDGSVSSAGSSRSARPGNPGNPGNVDPPAFSRTAAIPTAPIPPPAGEPPTTAFATVPGGKQPDVWSTPSTHGAGHRDLGAATTSTNAATSVNPAVPAAGQTRERNATGWTPPPVSPPPSATSGRDRPREGDFGGSGPYAGTVAQGAPASRDGFGFDEAAATRRSGTYPDNRGTGGHGGSGDPWDDPAATKASDQTIPPVPAMVAPIPTVPLVADEPDVSTSPALRLAAAGRTRRGKRGGPNEDAFVVLDGLLAVADGVGGEAAGQIASTLAVTTVASFRPQYAADPRDGLRGALDRANRTVREKPLQEPSWHGMACTLDVVVLGRQHDTGETLFVAHVGDSTVWLQPGRGRPRQLTTPHAIKNGPLLNAIGLNEEVELDLLEEPVRAGDRVVLASDGITKVMKPEQLDGLLMELGTMSPEQAADALVDAAMMAGARDDTTIVVGDLVTD
uniref:PP2C family protein-serine/threonine phosphatase n=1 Tax=Frankia sp. Cr1 TaxID=3073931 RepID=UPI002AD34BC6